MDDRVSRIEERLRQLDEAFDGLAARIADLESQRSMPASVDTSDASTSSSSLTADTHSTQTTLFEQGLPILTLVGRTFLVLGGAFLLRALTEAGRMPLAGGVVIGFAYASTWIGVADRAAVRRPASGVFHGVASLLIACPLLLEASTRFGVLSPWGAAILLGSFTSVALSVAWHRRLRSLGAIAAIMCALAAVALAWTTGQVLSFAITATAVAAVAEAAGGRLSWRWPPRVLAFVASLLVLALVVRAVGSSPTESTALALTAALLLALVYLVVLIQTTFARPEETGVTGLASPLACVLVGLGGSLSLAYALGPRAVNLLGSALMALGAGVYLFVLTRAALRPTRAAAVLTSLAALGLLIGNLVCLSGGMRDLAIGVSSIVLLLLGVRFNLRSLTSQGALFAVALAITSGLIQFSIDVWIGGLPAGPMSIAAWWALIVIAFAGVVLSMLRPDGSSIPTAWLLALTVLVACGVGALWIVFLETHDGWPPTPDLVAAERSVVLAALAVTLIGLSRAYSITAFRWLGYTAIAVGLVKLVAEDLRVSSPAALFLALGAFGAALIVSAKFLARPQKR